jgi:hypothetical protein
MRFTFLDLAGSVCFVLMACGGGTDPADQPDAAAPSTADTSTPTPTPTPTLTYALGGTVTGLTNDGLVLANEGVDDLRVSTDGAFTFATRLTSGAAYAVTIASHPTGQTCSVGGGTGTIGAADVTSVAVSCAIDEHTVGGSVSGLVGTVVLHDAAGGDLTLTANGAFAFATPLAYGASYDVSVLTQPSAPNQTCVVTNGDGTIGGADVTSIAIACTTIAYAINVSVTGLAGAGLVLEDNGADDLPIAADGTYTFATTIPDGQAYAVSVAAQPSSPNQTCAIDAGAANVAGADVTIAIACTTTTYAVNVMVTGMIGTGLVLQDDGADDLAIDADGTYAFATRIPDGQPYAITIATQPSNPDQICTLSAEAGNIAGADATATITCD